MSGFSNIALPGSVPTISTGKRTISPESLFGSPEEKAEYERAINNFVGSGSAPEFKVKKVKVETFDLSKAKDVEAYEKLWAELLEKSARMEVVVDSRKDLVHRKDGTSYWLKYVAYVEFGPAERKGNKDNGNDNGGS